MHKLILTWTLYTFIVCTLGAQAKQLEDFEYLTASGDVKVLLKKGNPKADYKIIKGDEDGLTIEVKGNELIIKTEANYKFWKKDHTKAEVTVYFRQLSGIDCSAGSRVSTEETLTAERFEVESSSGSSCSVPVEAGVVNADVSSGGKIVIKGKCDTADFDASSGGAIEAYELLTNTSNADASSGASIALNVLKELKADASSGASIRYKGNPSRTDLNSSVAGSIKSY